MTNLISPMAVIEENVVLGKDVKIGHFCVIKSGAVIGNNSIIDERCTIGNNVKIGSNNHIFSDVVVVGNTKIENNNHILSGCKIGFGPKDISAPFYEGKIEIGNDNFIGENTVINVGENHEKLGNTTRIGNRCYIMNLVTIHHNNQIGLGNLPDNPKANYDTIVCSGVQCNGFVEVRKGANIGCNSSIHQYRIVGEGALVAMESAVVRDVPPFCKIIKGRIVGLNSRPIEQFFNMKIEDLSGLLDFIIDISKEQNIENKVQIAEKMLKRSINWSDGMPFGIVGVFIASPRNGQQTAKWM